MAAALNEAKLKAMVVEMWRRGGEDTLVKVMSRGRRPDESRKIGYCTTIKYIAGRTPLQMEIILGFKQGTAFKEGAEIFMVAPLPAPNQFQFRSYSTLPAGVPQLDGKVINQSYPPGSGAPQWELDDYPQSGLRWLRTLLPGERLIIRYGDLPANTPVFMPTA